MGIYERHYKKLINLSFLQSLIKGKVPSISSVNTEIQDLLKNRGNILYKYIDQPERQVFNVKLYNQGLREIKFDIDTLYEEVTSITEDAVQSLNYADVYNKVNNTLLDDLNAQLENLLFLEENTDFYFDGVYDIFSDTSKLDIENSTEGVLSTKEQLLHLPFGEIGTDKINTEHLYRSVSPDKIKVINRNGLVSSQGVPGSSFGNMFVDTVSAWTYEVIKTVQESTAIELEFPIAGNSNDEIEVFINRVELIPHSPDNQRVQLFLSNDGVNFFEPVGYEGGVLTNDQNKVYSLDFETNLVQYARLRITKDQITSEVKSNGQNAYSYIFGLKNISFYQTGRFKKAVYQSKPLSFPDGPSIKEVSLKSDFFSPNSTKVRFSIAGADSSGNQVSEFIPVSPVFEGAAGINSVISFGGRTKHTDNFTVVTASTYGTPSLGKSFYLIGSEVDPKPIFGTARLFRGYDCWYRDNSTSFQIINIADQNISFAESDVEALYALTTEVPTYTPVQGTRTVQFRLSKPPYYNIDRGHQLIPSPSSSNSFGDLTANYAIYSVKQVSSLTQFRKSFSVGSSRRVPLPVSNFIVQSSNASELPVISTVGGLIYEAGTDYIIETETIGSYEKSTGYMAIPDGSRLLTNGQTNPNEILVIAWTPDTDVTHKVSAIGGNILTIDELVINPGDQITIEYRYIPLSPNEIIKASIRVADRAQSGSQINYYIEGSDYVFDSQRGIIKRLPTGNIPDDAVVYVSFDYRNAEEGIETFTTWAYLENAQSSIELDLKLNTTQNTLVADSELGENFYVNSSQGLIDLTDATAIPELPSGWVQFVVRSKNPTSNPLWQSNLIDQVIQLRDKNKDRVFRANGKYFSEIIAFREPMVQRTLNHLKVNTLLSDHTVFAIDDITNPSEAYIVVNFQPNETSELYQKIPSAESEADGSLPDSIDEKFTLTWYSETDNKSVTQLIVKIDLERSIEESDGGITPKVYNYHIRASR